MLRACLTNPSRVLGARSSCAQPRPLAAARTSSCAPRPGWPRERPRWHGRRQADRQNTRPPECSRRLRISK
eukprot:4697874-Lingulodinium_polyedra.AAC.1